MTYKPMRQVLEDIMATIDASPEQQGIDEAELKRLYGKKEKMKPDEKLTYTKCLLVSAMVNDENRLARIKQALYVLYMMREEQSQEIRSQTDHFSALAHHLMTPDELLQHAKELAEKKEHGRAVYNLQILIARNPNHAEAYAEQAESLRAIGRPEEALGAFRRAAELSLTASSYVTLAQNYLYAYRFDKATEAVGKALTIKDNYEPAKKLEHEISITQARSRIEELLSTKFLHFNQLEDLQRERLRLYYHLTKTGHKIPLPEMESKIEAKALEEIQEFDSAIKEVQGELKQESADKSEEKEIMEEYYYARKIMRKWDEIINYNFTKMIKRSKLNDKRRR